MKTMLLFVAMLHFAFCYGQNLSLVRQEQEKQNSNELSEVVPNDTIKWAWTDSTPLGMTKCYVKKSGDKFSEVVCYYEDGKLKSVQEYEDISDYTAQQFFGKSLPTEEDYQSKALKVQPRKHLWLEFWKLKYKEP